VKWLLPVLLFLPGAAAPPVVVLSATWFRFYTDLKTPKGLGGQEWSGFGVCFVRTNGPGIVNARWQDTRGHWHDALFHIPAREGLLIVHNNFWRCEHGRPAFMTDVVVSGRETPTGL